MTNSYTVARLAHDIAEFEAMINEGQLIEMINYDELMNISFEHLLSVKKNDSYQFMLAYAYSLIGTPLTYQAIDMLKDYQEDTVGLFYLALAYLAEYDYDNALPILKSAKLLSPFKEYAYGIYYEQKGDVSTAVDKYYQAGEQGYSWAYFRLGGNLVVSEDMREKGIEYLKKAAACNIADAYEKLGRVYSVPYYQSINLDLAVTYFEKAKELGSVIAAYELSQLWATDDKMVAKSVEYLNYCVTRQLPLAAESLGILYYYGRGVEQDYKKAYNYFDMAGNVFEISACYKAICHAYGRGVKADLDLAVKCLPQCRSFYEIAMMLAKRAHLNIETEDIVFDLDVKDKEVALIRELLEVANDIYKDERAHQKLSVLRIKFDK